jgi:nucleotide-binding universal stress UspA family protein
MTMAEAPDTGSAAPIIICYDGSEEAAEAIAEAGDLLPGRRAIVVSVWKDVIEEALTTAMTPPVADPVEANIRERASAEQFAAEGAQLAEKAGLRGEPLAVDADGPVWEAVELVAVEHDARLIVCGTRRSGVKATLPGNLSSSLVTHSSRPVLVVPSARTAAKRAHDVQEDRASRHATPRALAGAAARAKQVASASRTRVKRIGR